MIANRGAAAGIRRKLAKRQAEAQRLVRLLAEGEEFPTLRQKLGAIESKTASLEEELRALAAPIQGKVLTVHPAWIIGEFGRLSDRLRDAPQPSARQ